MSENPPIIDTAYRHLMTDVTLRDLFAGFALAGLLAAPGGFEGHDEAGAQARGNPEKAATWAYEYADEMLAARAPR